ncbi:MAG: aldo/keto reductase [Proteobacteria bacterium]|nr:aldo/keto reductase [Pseudomonadota bacterium]MBI3495859.1 aldo/keto reductase [Pseudomonadota bacterium]
MDPTLRRRLGRTSLSLTQMGFGGAPLGNLFERVPAAAAAAALERALAAGLGYFDTAPLYGHGLSEERMGKVLAAVPRERFLVSTKVGRLLVPAPAGKAEGGNFIDVPPLSIAYDYSYDGALRSVEASLTRLGLDRIDILLIHDIDRFTHGAEAQPSRFREAIEGAYPALARLRKEGTVGAIGLGVNEWQVCQQAAEAADFDCFLLAGRYTLLEQEALESFLPLCERRGIGIIIGGPFNSGILAMGPVAGATYNYAPAPPAVLERVRLLAEISKAHGTELAAAALQFPLFHPAVVSVIPGARSPEEVKANLALMRRPIPDALWRDLKSAGLVRRDAPTPVQ